MDLVPSHNYNLFELASTWSTKRVYKEPRTPNSSLRLMVIGGEGHQAGFSSIEYYCPRFKKWIYWKDLADGRKNFATAVMNNELYIIGGDLNGECLSSVRETNIL